MAATAFVILFCIVGLALWGLPFSYDFMVQQFGWSRAQVTSGNALSRLLVGPVFGFIAGWIVDHFGPRHIMMAGILMAGIALVGLASVSTLGMFYFFYLFNALGYVCGGPLPIQVLLSRWFEKARGKAMGFAYLGIGLGGALVPLLSHTLVEHFGWQAALRILGILIIAMAFPLAFLVKEAPVGFRPTRELGWWRQGTLAGAHRFIYLGWAACVRSRRSAAPRMISSSFSASIATVRKLRLRTSSRWCWHSALSVAC